IRDDLVTGVQTCALPISDTLIRVKESLDTGSFVGILGDRVSSGDKTTRCQFLGASATFPAGPVLLAAMMHCPVILFFGLYRGGRSEERCVGNGGTSRWLS